MKEKIFTKKETLVILMIFAALSFAFYWYELRPYFAKRDCVKTAEKFINSGTGQSFEDKYDFCLLRKGYK